MHPRKNTKYIKLLKSYLTTLQTIPKEGKYARSMENIYEVHQLVMNFFAEMESNNSNGASSSDMDIYKEVEFSFTDSELHRKRRKQKSAEIKLDILRDVIAEICDSLQTKNNTTRKGIQLLVNIVDAYLPLLDDQKELILRSIVVSKTKILFMPRKFNTVQGTIEKCDQLFLAIPFDENTLENNLIIKSTTTDPDVLHATSKTTLLTVYLKNCKENSPVVNKFMEFLIKQVKFCDSVLLNDTVDGMPLYHQIFMSISEVLMKNKQSNMFSEVQLVLWRELLIYQIQI
ncbi:hypothetical protein FDP41_012521 [Naegleria fowleri]|uniref:Uncharacterized protein n=1 Tax=Naegleria fowleri TaxID=5763 RepID=A0A6A5C305_NAEFO|nr:uncharacterized protein FDP41_012521 [Naegleria fowleri]KAF0981411.1 hypothetical protein FDP41_012521 [Naegleria fowleri]